MVRCLFLEHLKAELAFVRHIVRQVVQVHNAISVAILLIEAALFIFAWRTAFGLIWLIVFGGDMLIVKVAMEEHFRWAVIVSIRGGARAIEIVEVVILSEATRLGLLQAIQLLL